MIIDLSRMDLRRTGKNEAALDGAASFLPWSDLGN